MCQDHAAFFVLARGFEIFFEIYPGALHLTQTREHEADFDIGTQMMWSAVV